MFASHHGHRRAVLRRQCLEHGGFHDPTHSVEAPDVTGEQVVLDQAPVFGSVGADDGEVVAVFQLGPVYTGSPYM